MAGWIFIDDKKGGGGSDEMRHQMRSRMTRIGTRHTEDGEGRTFEDGYRHGYRHGWEDSEDESEGYRRRDSRGRFM